MKRLFLFLLAAACLFACSDDDEANEPIRLTGNTETSQVVYADETSKSEGIKFTAKAAWTAVVKDVTPTRSSEVDWLSLNMYSGGAGEYTLTMTLMPNLTGEDRVAEIVITCAETVIRIRVEQKATKEDGEKPEGADKRYVDNIVVEYVECRDELPDIQGIIEFTYNQVGKVEKISSYVDSNKNGIVDADERKAMEDELKFTYKAGEVMLVYTGLREGTTDDYVVQTGEFIVNEDGYVKKATYRDDDWEKTYNISYKDGYFISTDDGEKALWKDGNLVELSYEDSSYGFVGKSEVTYGNLLNRPDVSIDLNFVIASTECYSCFCETGNLGAKWAGFFGKRSKNMMTKECDISNGKRSWTSTYEYELDTDGYVTKITSVGNSSTDNSSEKIIFTINYAK